MRHPKGFDRYLGQDISCCLIAAQEPLYDLEDTL